MKRKIFALTIALTLLFSIAYCLTGDYALANPSFYLSHITIKKDGSLDTQTELIVRNGNVYTFSGNIVEKYVVTVQCSNIEIDGAGFSLNGSLSDNYGSSSVGLTLEGVRNVTVKNLSINNFIGYARAVNIEKPHYNKTDKQHTVQFIHV